MSWKATGTNGNLLAASGPSRRKPVRSDECHVYIFARQDGEKWLGPVKVGISNNVPSRLSTIRTSCPYKIGLYRSFRLQHRWQAEWVEGGFHRINSAKCTAGEWFDMEPHDAFMSCVYGLTFAYVKIHKEPMENFAKYLEYVGIPEVVYEKDGIEYGVDRP
jgi:hypothetical protein